MAVRKKTTEEDLNLETTQDTSNVFDTVEETIVEEKKSEKKEESIPLSLVQKMMKEMEEKFTSQIQKLSISKAKQNLQEDLKERRYLEQSEIDNQV